MALAFVDDLVYSAVKTSAASWTTGSPISLGTMSVGHLLVAVVTTDNIATTDGNTNDHTALSDSKGNAWTGSAVECAFARLDDVLGRRVKHYALTDHKEFFAEMTEAYFGSNDFSPFNRAELKDAEPDVYELMKYVWESPSAKGP